MQKIKNIFSLLLILIFSIFSQKILAFNQTHLELVKSGCKNLQNLDLKDAQLQNCNLTGADFRNSLLYNTNFSNANLSFAKLSCCDARKANFTKANLQFANLDEASLEDAILIEANLSLSSAKKTKFINTNCHNAKFRKAKLNHANFCLSHLEKANLCFAEIINTCFRSSTLKKATLVGIKANNTIFTDANMQGVAMPFATLTGTYFTRTKLQNSLLMGTSFRDVQTKEGYDITGSILFRGPIIIHGCCILIEITAISNTETSISLLGGIQLSEIDLTSLGIYDYFNQAPPEIKNFKKEDSVLNSKLIDTNKCPICMDTFEVAQKIAALPCGHILCQDCANHSLSYKTECPICRAKAESYKEISFIEKK